MFDPCMVSLSNHQSPHRDWSHGVREWWNQNVFGQGRLGSIQKFPEAFLFGVYLRCTFSTENSRFTPWQTTQLSLPTAATCASM
jgi:hypothetical protein